MSAVITAAVIAVIGAGVSAYGSYQSGKQQKAIANANAAEQERQAAAQLRTLSAQSQMQAAQAEINFKLRGAEARARTDNAAQLENQALQQDAINRTNLRKRRQDFTVMQSEQRTSIAASGLVEASGTPLDLLAETAAKIQQDAEEQHYAGEVKRRTIFAEANQERLGGELALQGATLDRNTGLTVAALTEATGRAEYLSGMRQAQITRMTGRAAQEASRYAAVGTLLSGASSAYGMTYKSS